LARRPRIRAAPPYARLMNRPIGVTLVIVLIVLSAVFDIITGIWLMVASFGTAPSLTDHMGNTLQVPGFYLFINGALSVLLGFLYFWLTKMTLIGSATARTIIIMLAAINIFFGLFRLPFGWGVIAASLVIILLVSTRSAKDYFTQAA
jgi:hypothetical protein